MISYDHLVFMVQRYLDVPKLKRAKQIGKRHTEDAGFKTPPHRIHHEYDLAR
jgi:hypothetical protein